MARAVRHQRPDPLPRQQRDTLLNSLRAGSSRAVACRGAGVPPRTLEAWLYRARGHNAELPSRPWHKALLADVEMAEAQCEILVIGNIVAATRAHPDVALRFAERKWPERWAPGADDLPALGAGIALVQQNVIIIPAERIPEYARSLVVEEMAQAGHGADDSRVAKLRVIEE